MSRTGTRRFAHQPALDGVRGAAVALVLLFHQGWISGGYVGVSVFFTLSGYLITSLALVEHDESRRLDVRAFYGRRVRRLMPASLACLLGIALLAACGLFGSVDHLRRDLWAALLQVYNWFALSGGQSYAQMVGTAGDARSPLDHYWSLAIEEQFYWVWPLALVVILRRPARGRIVLIAMVTGAAALAAPVIAHWFGPDAAYWATPARLGEILAGALLAAVLHARRGRPLPAATAWLAPLGGAVILGAALTWPEGSGPAYTGWLPVFALASVALIVGLQVRAPTTRALAWPPLVVLGAISYGVYLFHWPVFVLLDEERTNLPSVPLFALRVAVTLALAVVSYRVLERPMRATRARPGVVGVAAVAACASLAVVVATVPAAAARPYWALDGDDQVASAAPPGSGVDLAPVVASPSAPPGGAGAAAAPTVAPTTAVAAPITATAPPSSGPAAAPPTTGVLAASGTAPEAAPPAGIVAPALPAAPSRPVRVLVVGDSTAMATAKGLVNWAKLNPAYVKVSSAASVGCGFLPDGAQEMDAGGGFAKQCAKVRKGLPSKQASFHPDVVVGMVTLTDLDQRVWDPAEGPLGPTDPRFHDRLVAAYDAASASFLADGASDVVWTVPSVPAVYYDEDHRYMVDPARHEAYAAALREVAARHPGQVEVADVAAWVGAQATPPDRPDGLHWSRRGAFQLADQFLGPYLVTAALS